MLLDPQAPESAAGGQSRRKSLGSKGPGVSASWPTLIVPLFGVLAVVQAPANTGTRTDGLAGVRGVGSALPKVRGGPS